MQEKTEKILNHSHFVFDSRSVKKGSVFIALTTGARDGNSFAKIAFQTGADFLILSREPDFEIDEDRYIIVDNTLEFLTKLAYLKFEALKKNGVKSIAITGSIGKTTTKDFLIYLLKSSGKKVFGTLGNFNNHIGLPITILNTPFDIDFLVLEMGMNALGEISRLIKIANTDVRIITNISPAHMGNFQEGFYGIFKAKKEILENSTKSTILITIPYLAFLNQIERDFVGKINLTPKLQEYFIKEGKTFFSVHNKNFVINRLATEEWLSLILISFEVILHFGLPLPEDLSHFELPSGRGDETELSSNCILIDESYNASPNAVVNAIKTLSLFDGKKLAIIGGMKELGNFEEEEHKKIFDFVNSFKDIDKIFVGREFEFVEHNWFLTSEDLIKSFDLKNLQKYNVILVKASNSVNLTKFCEYIKPA
jgi:UDP-N-acetylmuramoyl-tripeptide--D-alanyl-D-alanine ligase